MGRPKRRGTFGLEPEPGIRSTDWRRDTPRRNRPPSSWEDDPRTYDGHAHDWTAVLVARLSMETAAGTRWFSWVEDRDDRPPEGAFIRRLELVILCRTCRAPRCGHAGDADPCVLVRHHREPHLLGVSGLRIDLGHLGAVDREPIHG